MQSLRVVLALACAVGMPALVGCGSGGGGGTTQPTGTFREFQVPVASNDPTILPPGSWPDDLHGDAQGNIWFAQHHSNEVGRMTPNGAYTGYPVPTANSVMDGCTVDKTRGIVWVTEVDGNNVVRVDIASGKVTEIPVPTPNADPGDLAVAPDGTVWFTEGYEGGTGTARLGRINPANNQISEVAFPTPRNGLDGICVDPTSGAVWFVEIDDNQVGRYLNGQFQEFALPRLRVTPTNPALDSHGFLWVTEQSGNAIARFDPTANTWQEFPVPTLNALPSGITIDAQDNVWFTEFNTSKIGLIRAGTATVLEYTIPTANSGPEDIYIAADGSAYFTEQYGNKIGQLTVH